MNKKSSRGRRERGPASDMVSENLFLLSLVTLFSIRTLLNQVYNRSLRILSIRVSVCTSNRYNGSNP